MLINYIRSIILYLVVLIITRLMGKREIGQLQPFEFVISIMIANLAVIPMSDIGMSIFNGIVPILGLLTMHLMIALFNLKSVRFRRIVCGKPTILVSKGKVDEDALKKERFNVSELQERLRENNIFNLSDVEYVILETNGDISVMTKTEKMTPTLEDLKIKKKYEGLTYNLVMDGVIIYSNLQILNKDKIWLNKQLKKYKLKPEDVLVATINEAGDFYCQGKKVKQ